LNNATLVAVALGSNLGDRAAHLEHAAVRLAALLRPFHCSPFIETAPVGMSADAPPFLNAAAVGETTLDADALLEALLAIERERGRERPTRVASRTLDLDLILYGDAIIDRPALIVPHPRFRERRFVLEPLALIAPAMRDPVTGATVAELLARLPPDPPTPDR
jgi:2-amino-4-hydroxy-6-hydroxymethyldihydropteridine diphosphokinase